MGKRTTVSIIAVIVSLLYMPLSLYYSWLLLEKVQGTDLMYFLFWLSIPFGITVTILSRVVEMLKE